MIGGMLGQDRGLRPGTNNKQHLDSQTQTLHYKLYIAHGLVECAKRVISCISAIYVIYNFCVARGRLSNERTRHIRMRAPTTLMMR